MSEHLLDVQDLSVRYPHSASAGWFRRGQRFLSVVEGVSLTLDPGQTLGLVGESGSGKTTTGRAILRQIEPSAGTIKFRGEDITHLHGKSLRALRRHMQMVFQDPYGSLNPRLRVLDSVAEPLIVHGLAKNAEAARDRVLELLELTGLPPDTALRYPHAFSGGQRQRIGIARALALDPDFLVVDEPVAALDTSTQSQVVNLLQDLQQRLGLAYLFIAHDLAVVRHISHRVAIMYAGQIVELSTRDEIYRHPDHPYTQSLLSAVPVPDPSHERGRERIVLRGEIPDPLAPPSGCRFHTRCPFRRDERCHDEVPALREVRPGHMVACHWAENLVPVADAR